MAGETSCVFDGDSSGQDTPVGFRDTPGQWYTANHRKRAALSQVGEPTQRDSQETEAATEAVGEALAPVFVAAAPSQEEESDDRHEEDEIDEEETQIRMTNSEEQDGAPKPERKIFEEAVPLPIASAESVVGRAALMENSDDDADSDMSDDMLEQDGSIAGLSSFASSFQQRDGDQESIKKNVYKPRVPFRASPALSFRDDSESSGGETEIEEEPKEESPAQSEEVSGDKLPMHRSASCSTAIAPADLPASEVRTVRRSLSTPEKTHKLTRRSKRDHSEAPGDNLAKVKRARHNEAGAGLPLDSLSKAELIETKKAASNSDEDQEEESAAARRSGARSKVVDVEATQSTAELKKAQAVKDAVADEKTTTRLTPRSQLKVPASGHGRKRAASNRSVTNNESAGSQAEGGAIRIILTGLEPSAAIRKKIRAIAGAEYESDIEKATHVIAPQNQLKRTVKLLCGISCCPHILGERWLEESARAGTAADEQAFCLRDEEAEGKWQFDLRSTMYGVPVEQRRRLFEGFSVFITNHKSVLPPVKDLVKIVECAGGKATSKGKPGPNDVVITSEAALGVATVRKQLVHANPERIYSPELILSGILQQQVALDKHHLERPAIGKTWATKRRK